MPPIIAWVAFLGLACTGYHFIEPEYTWLDALFMTVITVGTVGYAEVHPLTTAGRLWTVFVIIGGLTTGTVVLTMVAAIVLEGRIRIILGRREVERKIDKLENHIIVCGFGGTGSVVASQLTSAGCELLVVEQDAQRVESAEATGLLCVRGDAQEEDVLESAGIRRAKTLVAALSTDAENVFLTLTAKGLNDKLVIIVRAQTPSAERKLTKAGASRVICPKEIAATRMVDNILRPAVVDFVEMAGKGVDIEMDQLKLPQHSSLAGKTLKELQLPRRVGVSVVAVLRADGQTIYHPDAELKLTAGDTLILVGPRSVASAVEQLRVEATQI